MNDLRVSKTCFSSILKHFYILLSKNSKRKYYCKLLLGTLLGNLVDEYASASVGNVLMLIEPILPSNELPYNSITDNLYVCMNCKIYQYE